MKKTFVFLSCLFFCWAVPEAFAQSLQINEVMALNTSTLMDEDGDYPDWIEIHNATASPINLNGYGLSDDSANVFRWVFSDMIIPADEYIIIYASGKDRNIAAQPLHTNFKLKSSGTFVILTAPDGQRLDIIETNSLNADISFGRDPVTNTQWKYFNTPTPGWANGNDGFLYVAQAPQFSQQGGFYASPVSVALSTSSPQANIYYTTDGSPPTAGSTIYSSPISIGATTVLRAVTMGSNLLPSEIITNTFIFGNDSNFPIISLSTNPDNLWDTNTGIYVLGNNADPEKPYHGANFWQDWEKPVHIEFYEPGGQQGFSMDAGVSIYGGYSRANPQKSLEIHARDEYGSDKIEYKIFPDLSNKNFSAIILRNSGQDWYSTMFRDAFNQSLVKSLDIGTQEARPAIVYLNGEYWGIHNIREKLNEDFLETHYNVDSKNVDLLKLDWEVISGSNADYIAMQDFILNNDITTAANYDSVKAMMSVNNYIDYMVSQIYFDNTDWPGSNIEYWKSKDPGSKWKWLMYDTDFGFGLYDTTDGNNNTLAMATDPNGPEWPNPLWSTQLFIKLLTNSQFKYEFINRFADYANTIFTADTVTGKLDKFELLYDHDIIKHLQKWGTLTYSQWKNEVNVIRNFANKRIANVRNHFMDKFGLPGTAIVTLAVNTPGTGRIKINTIKEDNYPWSGTYFKNVPVIVKADPYPGYHFAGWQGITADSDAVSITLNSDITITAIFESDLDTLNSIVVINEINYNSSSSFNTEDWVELYNKTDNALDLSGWILKDGDDLHSFIIPQGTTLGSKQYLVIARDTTAFKTFFPAVNRLVGNMSFGFNSSGESVRLYDNNLMLIDSLKFDNKFPWPEEADGQGPTLSLKNPGDNNLLPVSWEASANNGTPGGANGSTTGIDDPGNSLPVSYSLSQNYPNPFNPSTTINYSIAKSGYTEIKIYNILGREVKTLVNEIAAAGNHKIVFNASGLASGVYFYRIKSGDFVSTKKLILLK